MDPSLVPLIRAEETRLAEELERARTDAQARIVEARRRAATRVETARQQIPEVIEKTHTQEIQDLDTRTETQTAQARAAVAAMEQQARDNMAAALEKIVALVLPEDTA
jgi:vacuolar-type H+-ATPase subunit H